MWNITILCSVIKLATWRISLRGTITENISKHTYYLTSDSEYLLAEKIRRRIIVSPPFVHGDWDYCCFSSPKIQISDQMSSSYIFWSNQVRLIFFSNLEKRLGIKKEKNYVEILPFSFFIKTWNDNGCSIANLKQKTVANSEFLF